MATDYVNPLTPELNPSVQSCLTKFLLGILIFKGLFFYHGWGWRKFRLSHFSLRGRLYSNPSSLVPPFISRGAPRSMRDLCERKEEVWARNGRSDLTRQSDFHVIAGFFNMPQSYDMGQTALLILRRKAC
jgi:hypothetical protein